MVAMTTQDPIALAIPIRPQAFGRRRADDFDQPFVEPLWSGVRVIAAATSDAAVLYDEEGEAVPELEVVRVALQRAVAHTAEGLIIDGFLVKRVTQDDASDDDEARPLPDDAVEAIPSSAQLVTKSFLGIRRNRSQEKIEKLDAEAAARTFTDDDVVQLVATDLLWLDGQWLLDVPLQERKRLLDSVIPASERIRSGPYVRPPFQTWIGSWRSQGFTGLTFKEANSRYRPGEVAADWTTADMPRR